MTAMGPTCGCMRSVWDSSERRATAHVERAGRKRQLLRLIEYLKEVRRQWCIVQLVIGALLLPRASAAA